MTSKESRVRASLKSILKVIFFPFLFMVNPKVFYPEDTDDEAAPGDVGGDSTPGSGAGGESGVSSGGDAG